MWIREHEFTVVARALMIFIPVAIVLAIIIFYSLHVKFPLPEDDTSRVLYMAHYVEVIQIIAVGVIVTLLSVIIPIMLPEARDRFERYKESRQAYSRAKTAVMYLPDKVLSTNRKTAFKLVEEAHRELHFAETFEQVIIDKGYLYWFKYPKLWVLYNYWQIVAVATVLRNTDWDSMQDSDELSECLRGAVKVVHETFGARGEKCIFQDWGLKDAKQSNNNYDLEKRYKREEALEDSIMVYLEKTG